MENNCSVPAPPIGGPLDTALKLVGGGRAVVVEVPASVGVPAFVALAAEHATADTLARVDRYGFGQGYLALSGERCSTLGLRPLSRHRGGDQPNQMESIDARAEIGVGLSAADRATTIRLAASAEAGAVDFVHPGHVVPLCAEPDGILRRAGATEAAVDLVTLAGGQPAAVMWPLLADDGSLPDAAAIRRFCDAAALHSVTVDEIVGRRWRLERPLEPIAAVALPTAWGTFDAIGYRDRISSDQHLALVHGRVAGAEDVLASHHEECVLGAALRATRCGCRARLEDALAQTADGPGVLVYSQPRTDPFAPCIASGEPPTRLARSLAVEYILADLDVRSVRWLGGRTPGTRLKRRLPGSGLEA